MFPTQGFTSTVVYFVVVFHVFAVTCTALVVTGPKLDGVGTTTERVATRIKSPLDLRLRIRSTNLDDIPAISNMLTHALLEEESQINKQQFPRPLNFRFRKIRSGVAPLLQSRMEAIQFGNKILQEHTATGFLQSLSQADQLRLLWSNDGFRNRVEKSASLSNEPHIWKEHNFMCAPQNFDWLFHKMITAENALTGEIVGFCEIAMLSRPSSESSESRTNVWDEECNLEESIPGMPTIVNLVTSTEYRRRGIGSAVMKSAMNYLLKSSPTWKEMALYVEEDNDAAIRVYERLGFRKAQRVESKKQWYMVRDFNSAEREEQIIPKVKDIRESYSTYVI